MIDSLYNVNAQMQTDKTSLYEANSFGNMIIKGTILQKDGKNIRISTDDNELFDIVTKNNLKVNKGQTLNIKKSEVEMIKKVTDENLEKEKQVEKEKLEELKYNNIEPTDENMDAIEVLKKYGIPVTKLSVEKFAYVKNLVVDITDKISMDSLSFLFANNKDINTMSLTKFSDELKENSIKSVSLEDSIKYYKTSQKMTYDDARKVAKEIYGSEMGKDIQDIIIALDSVDIDLTRENIDSTHDIFSKLYDIKDIDDKSILEAISTSQSISINLLYNVKNYVVNSEISSSEKRVDFATNSNISTITAKQVEDMTTQIKKMLEEMGLNPEKYEEIAKDLLKNGMEISKELLQQLQQTRDNLQILQDVLGKDVAAMLIKSDVDIPNMDISSLLDMIKQIQDGMLQFDFVNLTKEDMDLGKLFVDAIKNINSNTILSSDKTIGRLLDSTHQGRKLHRLVRGDVDFSLSERDRYLFKTASVLNCVKSIDFSKIDYTRNDISLRYIGEQNGIIESENYSQNEKTLVRLKYTHSLDISADSDKIKIQISTHYEYMRSNMRASHVQSLIKDGIDVWGSDIRAIGQFVREEIESTSRLYNNFKNLDTFEINRLASQILSEKNELNVGKINKKIELNTNHNSYFESLKNMFLEAKDKDFAALADKIDSIMRRFDTSREISRDIFKENISFMYNSFKDMEKIISQTQREDKDVFMKKTQDLIDNIKSSSKYREDDSFVQIPFFMNKEGSSANVYARSNSKKGKKIDPENMSVLIDLNTKNLGNMGFYLKVDKKDINLKISGDSSGVGRLRKQISLLSASFTQIGYNLNMVDLVTPENSAKVAFVEDAPRSKAGMVDVRV